MSRILIIANTYYQLILSIQMKITILNEDKVVLLISDHSNGAEKVFEGLKSAGVFEQVSFIRTKGLVNNRNKSEKLGDFLDIAFRNDNRYSYYLKDIDDLCFDEMICYNYHIDMIGLYSLLSRVNNGIKMSLFEEGVLSYGIRFSETNGRKLIEQARRIQGKKNVSDGAYQFYCYYPRLYKGPLKPVGVPVISPGSECTSILKKLFDLNADTLRYPQKFIYFSSVYDFECGKPIGEFELVKRIADLVGKDNLIIKTHPRDTRTVYRDYGLSVDKNSGIPWEAIQLSADFSDKVFMTATSGSVLAGSFMSEKPTKTFYMYKLCNISENYGAMGTALDIENLLKDKTVQDVLCKVTIVDNIKEITQ